MSWVTKQGLKKPIQVCFPDIHKINYIQNNGYHCTNNAYT